MPGNDILGVGLSGLLASQAAMDTISHNIANVNTPGYSRQRTDLAARLPQWSGGCCFGTGVDVAAVSRSYDAVLTRNVQDSTSSAADQSVQSNLAAQLDSLLGGTDTGLAPALQDFFNSIDTAAADPTSLASREVVISKGNQLAQRFQSLSSQMQQIQSGVRTQAGTAVGQINDLAQAIADLNAKIAAASGSQGQPNDLLDQRDQLVTQLAQQVGVTTTVQDDGALNVFIGTGQALVMGGEARQLQLTSTGADAAQLGVQFVNRAGVTTDVTSQITGGTLGGLLAFQGGMLADAQRQLDQLALGVAGAVNAQHQQGVDLQGKSGGLFFNDINSPALQAARATAGSGNTGSAALQVTVDDVGQLQDSTYRLTYESGEYSLTRLSDNSVVTSNSLSDLTDGTGFSITITPGPMAVGDSFTIDPAAGGASQIGVQLSDPGALALASAGSDPTAVGDNNNALALSDLQNQRLMLGGNATFSEQYSHTVSDVGAQTQALQTSAAAQQALLSNAQDAQSSYSGVNLDEEAANLLRYQQSYQASAKVIAAASDLFQVFLNAVGG
jgi:flagellar hook-associated protein 1 FlgK